MSDKLPKNGMNKTNPQAPCLRPFFVVFFMGLLFAVRIFCLWARQPGVTENRLIGTFDRTMLGTFIFGQRRKARCLRMSSVWKRLLDLIGWHLSGEGKFVL